MSGEGKPHDNSKGRSNAAVMPAWLTSDAPFEQVQVTSNNEPSEPPVVKQEAPKFAGFKPKFVPKVPVKKETGSVTAPVQDVSAANSSRYVLNSIYFHCILLELFSVCNNNSSSATTQAQSTREKHASGSKNGNNNKSKFNPQNKNNSDNNNQKGRKWVMPVGAAFFTGIESATPATNNLHIGGGGGSSSQGVKVQAGSSVGTGRPNEQITQVGKFRPYCEFKIHTNCLCFILFSLQLITFLFSYALLTLL
jgi:hypothetical protein